MEPICALASPPGRSAISVIRLSGDGTLELLEKIFVPFSKEKKPLRERARRALYGKIEYEGIFYDEVVLIPYVKPHSYTGEDAAEIFPHGNPILIQEILSLLYKIGFSPARPGEFTQRALLHGKIDLTRAEAIRSIIEARSKKELELSFALKKGKFREFLYSLRRDLLNITADLTAELDFSDEDIEFLSLEETRKRLQEILSLLSSTLKYSAQAQIYREGFSVAIWGAPNVGKSTLLNALLGEEKAITSEIPGTTRDYIEGRLYLRGIPVNFIDTAGIRQDPNIDPIEKIGIERTLKKGEEADLILFLIDASKKEAPSFPEKLQEKPFFLLLNKWDIHIPFWEEEKDFPYTPLGVLRISAKKGEGLENLIKKMEEFISQKEPPSGALLLASWQKDLLEKIKEEILKALSLRKEELELMVSHLQNALEYIGELTGEITTEELLGRVFSRFCIGK